MQDELGRNSNNRRIQSIDESLPTGSTGRAAVGRMRGGSRSTGSWEVVGGLLAGGFGRTV